MNHLRLLSRLYNTPLAIAESKLDIISSEVTVKLLSGQPVPTSLEHVEPRELDQKKSSPEGFAIIEVFDSLVSKNGAGLSGYTSYESIVSKSKQLIAEGYTTIYYYFHTPGGEVSGLFSTAEFIASIPEVYGVKTVGIVDGLMASAGYVLGSATQKLYATQSSIVGSIGVIMTLINTVKADESKGIQYKILRSKGEKALLNPHEPFDAKALESAEKLLLELDVIMNESVLSMRSSLSMDTIVTLNGNVVLGKEALELGLIDGIVSSIDELLPNKETSKLLSTNIGNTTMTLEESLAQNISLQGELQTLKANQSVLVASAVKKEQDRALGILDACTTFKLTSESAKKRIVANSSVEDSVSMFEEIAQHMQGSLDTTLQTSTITPVVTGESDFHTALKSALTSVVDEKPLFKGVI